jgi:hypothetical protein
LQTPWPLYSAPYCSTVAIHCCVGNALNVISVIKFRCTFNFLLLATLAVMDKFLSGYKRKDRDNEAGSNKDNVKVKVKGKVVPVL